jgi:hypothetical protein
VIKPELFFRHQFTLIPSKNSSLWLINYPQGNVA